jgi:hypothetical protein
MSPFPASIHFSLKPRQSEFPVPARGPYHDGVGITLNRRFDEILRSHECPDVHNVDPGILQRLRDTLIADNVRIHSYNP